MQSRIVPMVNQPVEKSFAMICRRHHEDRLAGLEASTEITRYDSIQICIVIVKLNGVMRAQTFERARWMTHHRSIQKVQRPENGILACIN